MNFTLRLVGERPTAGDLVLEQETPLAGAMLVDALAQTIRRCVENYEGLTHEILGALATYEMQVPHAMAVASELFNDKDTITVVAEKNILSHYIFYLPTVRRVSSGKPCYPFIHSNAQLKSYVDELAFLNAWANAGYATRIAMDGNVMVAAEEPQKTSGNGSYGTGCDGCSVGRFPPPPPRPMVDPLTRRPLSPPPPPRSTSTNPPIAPGGGISGGASSSEIPVGTLDIGGYRIEPGSQNSQPSI